MTAGGDTKKAVHTVEIIDLVFDLETYLDWKEGGVKRDQAINGGPSQWSREKVMRV